MHVFYHYIIEISDNSRSTNLSINVLKIFCIYRETIHNNIIIYLVNIYNNISIIIIIYILVVEIFPGRNFSINSIRITLEV